MPSTDGRKSSSPFNTSTAGGDFLLADVLITDALSKRPSRPPDYAAESKVLVALVRGLADSPQTVLQKLVDAALRLCIAGSAGVCVLEQSSEGEILRWQATAGAFSGYVGCTVLRSLSPSGMALDRNALQLMEYPSRYFPRLTSLIPEIVEILLIPFYLKGVPTGAVWVVSHIPEKRFDSEDARIMESLSEFASAALETLAQRNELAINNRELQSHESARERITSELAEALQKRESTVAAAEQAHREFSDQLERQARVFDTMLSTMPDFAYIFDLEGRFQYANKPLLDLWGLTLRDAVGKNFIDLSHPADLAAKLQRQIQQVIATRRRLMDETPYTSPTGVDGYYEYIFSPVFAADGSVEAVAGCTRVITDRKRAEDALVRASKEAQAVSVAKDRFLAVLSHELRTPLSPVVLAIPAVELDPELPAKFREDLAMVRRNIDLEVKLIDDLLDLSRITSGKLRLQMQSVHIHDVLRHAIRNSASDKSERRLMIREELHASNDRMTGDPARLQQVFWNLVRNAVKFTPDGGDIVIRTYNAPESGQLIIEVTDNGVGISPDILPQVFDAFEQGDARTTLEFGGLGLGLAIAKAVVEMHGGVIGAASDGRGCGATFRIRFDILPETGSLEAATLGNASAVRQQHSRAKVLLVEDHQDTARTLARLLHGSGYHVKTAHSVAAALQLADGEGFDIVVSDIGLPDATGYELMAQIKDRYGVKGIALSGYGMEDDLRRSREAGFAEHVTKPVNVEQLEAVIDRVCKATSSGS